jgi:hypothetical protein
LFKHLTYQRKLYLLLGGFVLFFLIAYRLSIKPTLDLKDNCQTAEEQLILAEGSSQKIQYLKKRLLELDQTIGTNISEGIDFQDLLLEEVSAYCKKHQLVFRDMQQTYKYQKGNYQIETNIFAVEGSFKPLLKLIYNLETNYNTGQIISIHFESKKDLKTKKRRLFVHVYYQNIKQIHA